MERSEKDYVYYIVYKPYMMLSQFKPSLGKRTLSELYHESIGVSSVGRLDEDSEGLLILTNDKHLSHYLLNPIYGHERSYLALVQGEITEDALEKLRNGVRIRTKKKDYQTLPCKAERVSPPENLPERTPPLFISQKVKYSWIKLTLCEGKFRQVRKMTAKVGYPTLRLIRIEIGKFKLQDMQPGEIRSVSRFVMYRKLFGKKNNKK